MANDLMDLCREIETDLAGRLPRDRKGKTYVDELKEQHADGEYLGNFFDEPLGSKDLSPPMVSLTLAEEISASELPLEPCLQPFGRCYLCNANADI